VSFATAFQANAFQNNAFQIYIPPPSTGKVGGDDAWTEDDLKKLRKLSAKIAERQRKLNQAIKDANENRKKAFKEQIDPTPVAKVKQSKVKSIQEVKADIPLAETEELLRSISYLEKQRNNILEAVAYRHQQYLIQEQLRVMEAKRQEELDDEAALLLLL
jgi:hypothetical protein